MTFDKIKLQSNNDISDIATLKLYAISSLVFLTLAFLPTLIS